jgi:hypothetical protein
MRSLKAGGPGLAFEAWEIGHPAILSSPKGRSAASNHKKTSRAALVRDPAETPTS